MGAKGVRRDVEKGEVGILTVQFAALLVVVLVFSNVLGTHPTSITSTPTWGTVHWGPPSSSFDLHLREMTTVKNNATTITAFYALATNTHLAALSAQRFCENTQNNNTGESLIYTKIESLYDSNSSRNYLSFGPVGQAWDVSCTYQITLTDSLGQVAVWVGTVVLSNKSST